MMPCIYAEVERVSQNQFSLLNQPLETYHVANPMLASDTLWPREFTICSGDKIHAQEAVTITIQGRIWYILNEWC